MDLQRILMLSAVIIVMLIFILGRRNKKVSYIVGFSIGTLLMVVPRFLPAAFFGTWNAIPKFKSQKIAQIVFTPPVPGQKLNLTGSAVTISDQGVIDSVSQYLNNTQVYFANRPAKVWETNLILVSTNRDSLNLNIEYNADGQTKIRSGLNEYRNDQLGAYLPKVLKSANN